MTDNPGDDRDALLAKGADVAATSASGTAVGDVPSYLRAYYRHVDVEDLASAGPERLAAVAIEQAAFAAKRPQGRAVVRVRRGGGAAFAAGPDVGDIRTDGLP